MIVYLNGEFLPLEDAKISVLDHGFLYGDGFFETLRTYNGVIFKVAEHMERFNRAVSLLGFNLGITSDELKSLIYKTVELNSLTDATVRVTVSRGAGPLGLDPEICPKPTIFIYANAFKPYPQSYYQQGIKVMTASVRRSPLECPHWGTRAQIKSINFLPNVLAKIESRGSGEVLLLDTSGYITECSVSNIFFVNGEALYTPSLECGILDGITRKVVIDIAKKQGITVHEGKYFLNTLYRADEVFLTNTIMEIMPVGEIDGRLFSGSRKVTNLLSTLYKKEVNVF
ncbi:aminotransferase class IV [Candidatus Magnetomonas plexicatena]|uniref:aminotransferase class IV n=1 Tax=Candidatus Magnetomonas plexicatena TaxID=2552947 RepID=UPI0011005508|nr:branched-chain amino acid aminotransferase [Nitrospirales bacterium LBB_01]